MIQILVTSRLARLGLVVSMVGMLSACGQKGPLYLPKGDAAAGRATLPDFLRPGSPAATAASGPASAPAARP